MGAKDGLPASFGWLATCPEGVLWSGFLSYQQVLQDEACGKCSSMAVPSSRGNALWCLPCSGKLGFL